MDGTSKPKQPENYKREIAFILFKRTKLIMLTALAIFLGAIAIVLYWPPTYGAYGSVLLKSRRIDRDPTVLENTELRSGPVTDNDVYSELSIITSDELFGHTVRTLERKNQTGALATLGEYPEMRIAGLRASVTARVVPTTTLVEVTMTGGDPDATLVLLQSLFETYFWFRQRIYTPGGATEVLGEKVRRVQAEIAERNKAMGDFLARTGLSNADQQIQSNLAVRGDLEAALLALDRAIADLKAEIAYLNELLTSRDVQMLASVHMPGNVTLTGRADIASYLRQHETRLAAAQESRANTAARIDAIDQQNQALRRHQLAYDTMLQEATVLQHSYQTLLTRHAEATMEHQPAGDAPNPYVSFLVSPRKFDDKIFPRAGIVLPVGLVAGLLLGVALAFIKESLDHTFTRPEDVEHVLGIPVVLSIPAGGIRRTRWKGVASQTGSASPAWAMQPRFPWLRRAVQLALVAAVLWAVGLMARGGFTGDVISITEQPQATSEDFIATVPDTGELRTGERRP